MAITLHIGNSYSKITGLIDTQFNALRKELSYRLDHTAASFIPNPANHIKYMIDLKGNFASGLLPRVTKFLDSLSHQVVQAQQNTPIRVNRAFKPSFNITPYPDQELALKSILKANRGIISYPTGCGKSMIIAMALVKTGLRTQIIVPTLELKLQLTESLKEQLTSMEGISVENIDSNKLKDASAYDALIIDEAHHSAAKTYHKLNKSAWGHIQYRWFFTATAFRNNPEETLMFEAIAGNVIYELLYKDAVKAGYIVPVEAYYLEIDKSDYSGVTYAQVYNELVVNNAQRNLQIALLLARLHSAGKSTLCLVKEINHGHILAEATNLPFANGGDNDTRWYIEAFAKGRINSLIGTTGLIGEGIDTKPCEFVIIAGLGKAKSQFLQQVGRAVRKYDGKETAKVIIIKDLSHKWTKAHFKEQCKILLDYYNVNVVKLTL